MILDAHELPADTCMDADIAIVGAGPAGITLAHELMGAGLLVVVLEAGGRKAERTIHDSFSGEVLDIRRHPPAALYRVRGLGGTSTLWGGRCVPFDPIDLESRDYVPHSGWPLTYAELAGWYGRAAAYCEAGPARFRAPEALGESFIPAVPGLAGGSIEAENLQRFSKPTNFGKRYRKALERSRDVSIVLSANCIGMRLTEGRQAVESMVFAADPDHRFTVRARHFVLAAGALETARLMLAAGAGNDNVGRYYMCHVEGKAAVARFRPGTRVAFEYERDSEGVYIRRHFSVPAEIQRARRLNNVILRFEPPLIADPSHENPVLSAMWLSRTFLKREYARKMASFGYRGIGMGHSTIVARHAANVAKGWAGLAAFGVDWTRRHILAERKLPYVAVAGKDGAFTLDYNAEQAPNPDSRVFLAGEMDAYGLPRLVVDWRASAQDIDSVLEAHRLLAARMAETAIGRLDVDEACIREGYNAAGGHHIGTARMSADPAHGVVDPDCRVHGMDNLFVAGAAAFPTSSHANPTLTLVALAARLAARLRALEDRPSQSPEEVLTMPQAAE